MPWEQKNGDSNTDGDRVVSIAVSGACSAAVTASGKLFTWGREDGNGQTGLQQRRAAGSLGVATSASPFWRRIPTRVWALTAHACQVVMGAQHTAVCCADGSVYAFGDSSRGQCGQGLPLRPAVPTPHLVKVPGTPFVTALACGMHHTVALDHTGAAFGWGSNNSNELGSGPAVFTSPQRLALPSNEGTDAAADGSFALQQRPQQQRVAYIVAGPRSCLLYTSPSPRDRG